MSDEVLEGKQFATFEKHGEFVETQAAFLAIDFDNLTASAEENERQTLLFNKLSGILSEYQEQSYLLDSFLEGLVTPVVASLKQYVKKSAENGSQGSPAVERLALHLYHFIKCRGYKTIIRFFPHEIADLSIALNFMRPGGLARKSQYWALQYIGLIWLSLICMLPFDLEQFDEPENVGKTATDIDLFGKEFLGTAGLSRDGAALLLTRLYKRNDARSYFYSFLEWSNGVISQDREIFMTIGILQVLSEVVKSDSAEQVQHLIPRFLGIIATIEQESVLPNTIRKYRAKLLSRIALRLLPVTRSRSRRKGRTLSGTEMVTDPYPDLQQEVPEEVEGILEQLLTALKDNDTIVRWSSAKGIARICERLPSDFADQVLETILGLFSIHSMAAARVYDLPAIAECTWHGASLACAEMARRDLIQATRLPELMKWLSQALYFDLRKGSHSIGSNVRDAASYVLWALARSQDPAALIHIRRAASAAFQEHVGRTSLFPHGIDVLRKTDFYAVSIRKHAFLTAATQVAEHPEYRIYLFHHVLDVVLRHWDISMRELGSQSLRLICLLDLPDLGPKAAMKAAQLVDSSDLIDLHGGLLALIEITMAFCEAEPDKAEEHRSKMFQYLSRVPLDTLLRPRNELVAEAACRFIACTLTAAEVNRAPSSIPVWKTVIDHGMKHRSEHLTELSTGLPPVQQSLGRVLGVIDYNTHPNSLPEAIDCLLECIGPNSVMLNNIEARRNCYQAIVSILCAVGPEIYRHMPETRVMTLYNALLTGLDDYTIDNRGDVGSWIRIVCIRGLAAFSATLISNASTIPQFEGYLPPACYRQALAGILKQGVERLDNVRREAGECFLRLLVLDPPDMPNSEDWYIPGRPLLEELFINQTETETWNNGKWLFPRAMRLLEVPEYRASVLRGLVLSLGSKTDSTQRPVATSLINYVRAIPHKVASNVVVIPVLQAFNVLLGANALHRLEDVPSGLTSLKSLLVIVTKKVSRLKNPQRIHESMCIVVHLLSFKALFPAAVAALGDFLGHTFPSVRVDTAEFLYLFLQSVDLGEDTDEIEEILLETEWPSDDGRYGRRRQRA
ncbi:ARM repeat-containing protein [Infundibulicybe gibba]|nr:ARM repeat-containing protein [Infundibulicybe gibba]